MSVRRLLVVLALAVIGCGKGEKKPNAEPPAVAAAHDAAPPTSMDAAPKRVLEPPPVDYARALRLGRKLEKSGDYAAASAAFATALASVPGDARALSELSWVELKLDHHEAARKAASDSVANTANPKLQAASLYNLGRAEQALGHRDAAVTAYQRSLTLRPNKVVARQLQALTGRPATPLAAAPLDGPFATLEEACKLMPDRDCHRVRHDRLDSAAPWLHVALFSLPEQSDPPGDPTDMPCNLTVRTKLGWFVRMEMFDCDPLGDGVAMLTRSSLVVQKKGAPVLSLEHSIVNASRTSDESISSLFLCGIGASGVPACTRAIPIGGATNEYDPESETDPYLSHEEWAATAVVGADGVLTVAGDSPLEGAHALAFP